VLTDAPGFSLMPTFFRELHSLAARALNAHYGRGENFWRQPGSYDNVELHRPEDVTEKLRYAWTNPVKDGLCATPDEWEGVLFLPEDFGTAIVVPKPEEAFFGTVWPADWEPTYAPANVARRRARRAESRAERERLSARTRARGRSKRRTRHLQRERERRQRRVPASRRRQRPSLLPSEVRITISPPPGWEDVPIEEVRKHFRRLLDQRVAQIHAERKAAGLGRFRGVEAVRKQDPLASVGDTFPTFARNPRAACRGNPPLYKALLRGLTAWRAQYRDAVARWSSGDRSAVFPWGSYWLPFFHGAELGEPARGPPLG
jgi:hypothetical protein